MSLLITFIKTVSAASVVLAAANILKPKGKMEKTFKYALGLFSVSVIIFAGITALSGDFNFEPVSEYTFSSAASIDMNNTSLTYAIENLLKEKGIKYSEIEINTDILEDGRINITKAEINCSSREEFLKAYNLILNETGIKITEG